ncbi:MAG: TolC family protein [Candidatus Omnitrophica bacterium]|nr:TolC family protein [Candidatus Omnitrophota bacterium]
MSKKSSYLSSWIKSKTIFIIFLCFLLLNTNSANSFAASQASPPSREPGATLAPDEIAIMDERDQAIRTAVETLSKSNQSNAKTPTTKRINLGKTKEKKSIWERLFFWEKNQEIASVAALPRNDVIASKEKQSQREIQRQSKKDTGKNGLKSFFSRSDKKSANWEEVVQKRKERRDEFPSLDPEQIRESITDIKIELKQDFLNSQTHNLDDVIRRAIQVHLPAQIAHERIMLADRRILKAFRDFFSEAELTRHTKDGTLEGGPYTSHGWRASFRQPLFKGGVLWNTFKLEMEARETAKRELEKIVSDLVAAASNAYFEYEYAESVLSDKESLFGEAKKAKDMSDQKAEANLISEIEKLNIDSLYGQIDYDLETAKQDLELAKLELQTVLELDLSDPIEIKPTFQVEQFEIYAAGNASDAAHDLNPSKNVEQEATGLPVQISGRELERLVDLAYVHRPDLQVEASKLHAARLTHKISVGKLLPEAEMIIEFGALGEAFEGADRGGIPSLETTEPKLHNEWRIGAEISWKALGNTLQYSFDHDQQAPRISAFQGAQGPIAETQSVTLSVLDSLNSLAELKETKIGVLEQVVALEKTERDVIREVKEAYFNYNKALIQAQSSYKRMKYRERLEALAKHRLDNNEIQLSEYLQTKIDYDEERGKLYKALADFYAAKVDLNRAIGVRDYLRIE